METKKDSQTNHQTAVEDNQATQDEDGLTYLHGLDNHYESEAVPQTLPKHRNNPKVCPKNLYTEQLSGTAFTVSRHLNKRTWLYRTRPSVSAHGPSTLFKTKVNDEGDEGCCWPKNFGHLDWNSDLVLDPNPMRWLPRPIPSLKEEDDADNGNKVCHDNDNLQEDNATRFGKKRKFVNFIEGTRTMMGCGDPTTKNGIAIHIYTINSNMRNEGEGNKEKESTGKKNVHMYNSDGDFLIVPQHGSLDIQTELGRMIVHSKEICVIPRGIVFSVNIYDSTTSCTTASKDDEHIDNPPNSARGYILEIFSGHFHLPELGPIGSNGLANARDFCIPTASFESHTMNHTLVNKFGNTLFYKSTPHSPYNVVAWHGNYVPFKYNLEHYCAMNSVTYDHPDPSIHTVLTVPNTSHPDVGTALADFVIFPHRIMATDDNTFRPPWFHRNCMSEFMGLIYGQYDAKKVGFLPGGCSLHNCMTPHGPDADTFHRAIGADYSRPTKFEGGLAFMFETSCMLKVSKFALGCEERDLEYAKCWEGLDSFA